MADYYEILGVSEEADLKEIKKAYKSLAMEWHPDKHQGKDTLQHAEEKFKKISEAYSILTDSEKRSQYDKSRKFGNQFHFSTTGDPFDFANFFTGSMFHNFQRADPSKPQPKQGHNVQLNQDLTLYEALFGTSKPIEYDVKSGCEECGMRGSKVFETCSSCGGSGYVGQKNSNQTFISTCSACGGKGSFPKEPCQKCSGTKLLDDHRKLTVNFPAGLYTGAVIRLRSAGGPGFLGGPDGDVLIQIRVSYPNLENFTEEERSQLQVLLSK